MLSIGYVTRTYDWRSRGLGPSTVRPELTFTFAFEIFNISVKAKVKSKPHSGSHTKSNGWKVLARSKDKCPC